ncbi:ExbD/TolR family protein [Polymorphum gilvum]|uniref:Biopolymer transport protein ExbD/TolR n=1 Tax=Polymorphum gilvum (strain LMG 25793 / CGMCC 1.9160 / SL003B-26A1) TaxID=991905 RepID=F2IZW1_POLGS|nr:biopolymer transporter ExbD [Polymorphum gilvum]ADZ70687.1 Biopolymer transport protein ExbD/TolR [Polymorphum gilvum SL003B-26A1]
MKTLRRGPQGRKTETTISLINIVFLMLIFFLIAGQLAPPADPEVDLVTSSEAEPLPPPDALFARADGSLVYRGAPISPQDYIADHAGGAETPVRLGADQNLPAIKLIDLVDALHATGAARVEVVTRRPQQ